MFEMELSLDFKKLKQIISAMPESKAFLSDKTNGFKYLYEKVYNALLGKDTEYVELNVDIRKFDFDDLSDFEKYIDCKLSPYKNPVLMLSGVIGKLKPTVKPTVFI
jgi:hypothetical protein